MPVTNNKYSTSNEVIFAMKCSDNQAYRIRKELKEYLGAEHWIRTAERLPRLQDTLTLKEASDIISLFVDGKPKEATRLLFTKLGWL